MLFLTILLLSFIEPSIQIIYSCNPKATCGCSLNPVSMSRIVGGENASKATWEWIVSISVKDNILCGGSILSSSWIITAAHCVENYMASHLTVFAGSIVRWSGTQNRSISKIIIHHNYDSTIFLNDIALLQLSSPLMMNDPNVSPICIPSINPFALTFDEFPPNGTTV